jgi:hypothetical protein
MLAKVWELANSQRAGELPGLTQCSAMHDMLHAVQVFSCTICSAQQRQAGLVLAALGVLLPADSGKCAAAARHGTPA